MNQDFLAVTQTITISVGVKRVSASEALLRVAQTVAVAVALRHRGSRGSRRRGDSIGLRRCCLHEAVASGVGVAVPVPGGRMAIAVCVIAAAVCVATSPVKGIVSWYRGRERNRG